MKRLWCCVVGASVLGAPLVARAASLSGILLYMSDFRGFPNAIGPTADNPDFPHADRWRTLVIRGDPTFGLAVFSGLPPESLQGAPLNGLDFSIELPLVDGDNEFTLVAEPGVVFSGEEHDAFVLNLYFDGVLERPGISVLLPSNPAPYGSPVTPNRHDFLYPLSFVGKIEARAAITYEDGVVRVSVTGVSFLDKDQFIPDLNLVDRYALRRGGEADALGVLRLSVEPAPSGAGPVVGPGPQGFGVLPGGGSTTSGGGFLGRDTGIGNPGMVGHGSGAPNVTGDYELPRPNAGAPNAPGAGQPFWRAAAPPTPLDDTEPSVTPLQSPTPEQTLTPAGTTTLASRTATPSPGAHGTTSPTVGSQGTPSAAVTPTGPTPAHELTASPAARTAPVATPTPAARKRL